MFPSCPCNNERGNNSHSTWTCNGGYKSRYEKEAGHTSSCHGNGYLVCQCKLVLGESPETLHLKLHLTDRRVNADAATHRLYWTCQQLVSYKKAKLMKKIHWWIETMGFLLLSQPKAVVLRGLLLTFAEVDRHAFRLEQAVVLTLGRVLCLYQGGWLSQRVGQHRGKHRGRRHRGGRWGGGDLTVDGGNACRCTRHGWRDELSAQVQQAAGHLVDVERRFCTGIWSRRITGNCLHHIFALMLMRLSATNTCTSQIHSK